MTKETETIYEVKFHKEVDTKLTPGVHDTVKKAVTVFVNIKDLQRIQSAWLRDSNRKCIVSDNEVYIGLDLDKYEAYTCKQIPITGVFSAENHRLQKEDIK